MSLKLPKVTQLLTLPEPSHGDVLDQVDLGVSEVVGVAVARVQVVVVEVGQSSVEAVHNAAEDASGIAIHRC